MTEYANYIITAIGLVGFWLAGRKVWWAWYVNIANQILWFAYGVATEQWGFVVGTFFYTFVFVKNAIAWTKEHRSVPVKWDNKRVGTVVSQNLDENGMTATMRIDDPHVLKLISDMDYSKFSVSQEDLTGDVVDHDFLDSVLREQKRGLFRKGKGVE